MRSWPRSSPKAWRAPGGSARSRRSLKLGCDPEAVDVAVRQFRCVAVIGVTEDALPFPKTVTPPEVDSKQHETDMLSERCLLFVACTRARDSLYVCWPGKPSPLWVEAGVQSEFLTVWFCRHGSGRLFVRASCPAQDTDTEQGDRHPWRLRRRR